MEKLDECGQVMQVECGYLEGIPGRTYWIKPFLKCFEVTLIYADVDVVGLTLLDEDTVEIRFKGGGKRKVNIAADSYSAIITDVMKCVH